MKTERTAIRKETRPRLEMRVMVYANAIGLQHEVQRWRTCPRCHCAKGLTAFSVGKRFCRKCEGDARCLRSQ